MSAEQVKAFLKLLEDANFRAAFEAAAPEARRAMLTKAGLAIPLEKAEAALKGERELAEQELDKVAGGYSAPRPEPPPDGENAPDHLVV